MENIIANLLVQSTTEDIFHHHLLQLPLDEQQIYCLLQLYKKHRFLLPNGTIVLIIDYLTNKQFANLSLTNSFIMKNPYLAPLIEKRKKQKKMKFFSLYGKLYSLLKNIPDHHDFLTMLYQEYDSDEDQMLRFFQRFIKQYFACIRILTPEHLRGLRFKLELFFSRSTVKFNDLEKKVMNLLDTLPL